MLRQKGFVTGLVGSGVSVRATGQACIPVCHHRSVSRPRTGFSI
ncbi:putative transposase [Shigella flexneri K-272]|nr:putative transposase [Shigella flexneri K-272]